MNILFTNFCNKNCPYCFAKGKLILEKRLKRSYISLKNLKIIVNFLKRSKEKSVGIMGGEPTLHPKFKEAITMLLSQGMRVTIFSNGIINADIVGFLQNLDKNKCSVILNINAPESYTKKEWSMIKKTMKSLNRSIKLGFNIYRLDFNMDFLIRLIQDYNLDRSIRVAIANPLLGQNNVYIPLKEHRKIAPKIIKFAQKCDSLDITLNFDCGFTLCSFTERECGKLFYYNSPLKTFCEPGIDVGPDLIVWRCFVTSMLWNKRLTDFRNTFEINKFYINKFMPFHRIGATNKCFKCKYLKRGQCGGGCLGHTLKFFHLEKA